MQQNYCLLRHKTNHVPVSHFNIFTNSSRDTVSSKYLTHNCKMFWYIKNAVFRHKECKGFKMRMHSMRMEYSLYVIRCQNMLEYTWNTVSAFVFNLRKTFACLRRIRIIVLVIFYVRVIFISKIMLIYFTIVHVFLLTYKKDTINMY